MRTRNGFLVAIAVLFNFAGSRELAAAQPPICQENRGPGRPCSIDTFGLLAEGEVLDNVARLLGIPVFFAFLDVALASEYFRTACQRHYECYRYGPQTYGYDRGDCDDKLYNDMTRICNAKSGFDRDLCFMHRDIVYEVMKWKGGAHFSGASFWNSQRTGPYCEYSGVGRNFHLNRLAEQANLLFAAGRITRPQLERIQELVARFTDPSSYDTCGQTIPQCRENGRDPLLSESALHYQLLDTIDPARAASLLENTPGCEVRIVYELVPKTPSGPGYVAVERIAGCDDFRGYQFDWRNAFLNRWGQLVDCRLGPDDDGDGISNSCDLCPKFADPTNTCAFVDAAQAVLEDPNWARGTGWGDYDGDGDLDLYQISMEPYPNGQAPTGTIPRLFRNLGNGTFQDVTSASGFLGNPAKLASGYPHWIDYDNDGRLDIYIDFRHELLHNEGNGKFTDATSALPPRDIDHAWSTAIWFDFDQDGLLDVHLFRFSDPSVLLRNAGGSSFEDISNLIPTVTEFANWIDVDGDGDLDLYACHEDLLYRNQGSLQFAAGEPLGIGGCGTWGDFDSDGDIDVFVPPAVAPRRPAKLLRNDQGAFVDVTPYSFNDVSLNSAVCTWIDFDNDGLLDIHVNQPSTDNRSFLLRNLGQGDFADAANDLIANFDKYGQHTWGDYNKDGYLDLFQANGHSPITGTPIPPLSATRDRLLRNTIATRPNRNKWLQVDLVGTRSNSHGIGSRILLHQRDGRDADGEVVNHTQVRYVMASPDHSLTAQFGLGPVPGTVDVEVLWPSGTVQTLSGVDPDRHMTITEPAEHVFPTPLRIDIGGRQRVDSLGRTWLGDITPLDNDPLRIRPDTGGGATTARGWLEENFRPESIADLGFDPTDPDDRSIFTSMRVDQNTTDGKDFLFDVPVANGFYLVNLYFCDNETDQRRFKIGIQGEMVDADVGVRDYSPNNPVRGWAGRLQFPGIEVADGLLRIALLPCPAAECPGGTVARPFLSALEVLSLPRVGPPGLVTGLEGKSAVDGVQLTWIARSDPGVSGYHVYRALDRPGEVLALITEGLVESPSYLDTTAKLRFSYRYRVAAVNVLSVEGPLSSPMVITFQLPFRLYNIRLSPPSPDCLPGDLDVTFDYDIIEPVRVRAVPDTTGLFRADPSPEYAAGVGTGTASFVINRPAGDIQRIKLEVLSPDLSRNLYEQDVRVDYRRPCRRFRRGDPNDSGSTDIADALTVFNYLFLGGATPGCLEAADANNSGDIDITDGVVILNFLFLGGNPPAAPGHDACGIDPDHPGSAGDGGCGTYASC